MRATRAFTLIELLVVVAIMGFLGTLSVGGYRAMQRGMEERSVMQNANRFIRAAYERAQIDRQPVTIYFWNEILRAESQTENAIVVGKAIAVRRFGRISNIQGSYLYDEFGDLRHNALIANTDGGEGEESNYSGDDTAGNLVFLYRINGDEGNQCQRQAISQTVKELFSNEPLLDARSAPSSDGDAQLNGGLAKIPSYAYVTVSGGDSVSWKIGDAYGFEFAEITLPHGYTFGNDYPTSMGTPTKGWQTIRFKVSANSGNGSKQGTDGASTIDVYSLRPGKSGSLESQKVATTRTPTESTL